MANFKGYDGFKIISKKMDTVFEEVYDFARNGQPIIMFGPSGSGKEFLARYYFFHYNKVSDCTGEFVSLNCSQLVRETAHSILFGHIQGSFTDARDQKGQFELAKDGVLFLDELGDLDKSLQMMVNRAMEEENPEATRLGDEKPYTTEDVMVICATERPTKKLNVSLLFRAGHQIFVPGMDERDEDVEEAIKYFCMKAIDKRLDCDFLLSKLLNQSEKEIDDESINDSRIKDLIQSIAARLGPVVRNRDWPGNFRALRTAVDSGMIRAKKLSSADEFIDDVEKYFLHHLGNYSISGQDDLLPIKSLTTKAASSGIDNWIAILNQQVPDLDDREKTSLSSFLAEFENIPFKRKIFEEYMNLNTRNAQLHIKELKNKNILEDVPGKGYKYQVTLSQVDSGRQGISAAQFMELPGPVKEDFLSEKILEAQGFIENSRGLFVSDDDSQKRESFFGALGNRLKENHDVIYYSFHEHSLDDFLSACVEHLSILNMDGWFRSMNDDTLDLKGKISGLSGYFVQSLSRHRKTIIILEGIDVFSTSESQALIEQLIYYWYPVQFVLGSTKQFFQQGFSNSEKFTEVKLSK